MRPPPRDVWTCPCSTRGESVRAWPARNVPAARGQSAVRSPPSTAAPPRPRSVWRASGVLPSPDRWRLRCVGGPRWRPAWWCPTPPVTPSPPGAVWTSPSPGARPGRASLSAPRSPASTVRRSPARTVLNCRRPSAAMVENDDNDGETETPGRVLQLPQEF